MPLVFVIALSMIREAYEDLMRHKSDIEVNASETDTWNDGGWVKHMWKDLKVGEIVRIRSEEFFPSDLILLSSSSFFFFWEVLRGSDGSSFFGPFETFF
jgi:P-type E1-E2 ATPase